MILNDRTRPHRMARLLAVCALLVGLSACNAHTDETGGLITGEGTIRRGVGPECAETWAIATSDGGLYWPVEDVPFQVEGMRVRFTARERTGVVSICMAGTIVDMIEIEKI